MLLGSVLHDYMRFYSQEEEEERTFSLCTEFLKMMWPNLRILLMPGVPPIRISDVLIFQNLFAVEFHHFPATTNIIFLSFEKVNDRSPNK